MQTERLNIADTGIVEYDRETYPGQYDPIDLSELELSYEYGKAQTLFSLHFGNGDITHVIKDVYGSSKENRPALLAVRALVSKAASSTGGDPSQVLTGDILLVRTFDRA